MISKFFDEVIVLSLRSNDSLVLDKQKAIKEQLDSLGIPFTMWEGFNATRISNPSFAQLTLPPNALSNGERKRMRMGELGCLLSWISVLQYAKSKKLKGFLALEDDVILSKDFKERMRMLDEECPEDAGVIFLGGNTYSLAIPKKSRLTEHIWELSKSYKHFGTFCHIITEKAYNQLLDAHYKMEDIVDVITVKECKYGEVKGYMMLPYCGYNPVNYSGIAGKVVNNYSNLLYSETPTIESCPAVNEKWEINRKGKWAVSLL
jgi:GR25 family glycosyltransferase involved in LPS biosynthesis